ncbi:hypothetical protein EDB85DRAFT_1897815 [Lactarius pseudohatsudake]|nr:hypothetical protein EDB85DRAFT_1897815 [Lactarius pseudohatsudake]
MGEGGAWGGVPLRSLRGRGGKGRCRGNGRGGGMPLRAPLPRKWGRVGGRGWCPCVPPSRAYGLVWPKRRGGPGVACPRAPPFHANGEGGGVRGDRERGRHALAHPPSARMGKGGAGGGVPSRAPFPHVPGHGQWGRVALGGVLSHAPFLRVRGGAAKGEGEVPGASCPRAPLHGKGGAGERGRVWRGQGGRGGRRRGGGDLPSCAPFLRSNGVAVNAGEREEGATYLVGRWPILLRPLFDANGAGMAGGGGGRGGKGGGWKRGEGVFANPILYGTNRLARTIGRWGESWSGSRTTLPPPFPPFPLHSRTVVSRTVVDDPPHPIRVEKGTPDAPFHAERGARGSGAHNARRPTSPRQLRPRSIPLVCTAPYAWKGARKAGHPPSLPHSRRRGRTRAHRPASPRRPRPHPLTLPSSRHPVCTERGHARARHPPGPLFPICAEGGCTRACRPPVPSPSVRATWFAGKAAHEGTPPPSPSVPPLPPWPRRPFAQKGCIRGHAATALSFSPGPSHEGMPPPALPFSWATPARTCGMEAREGATPGPPPFPIRAEGGRARACRPLSPLPRHLPFPPRPRRERKGTPPQAPPSPIRTERVHAGTLPPAPPLLPWVAPPHAHGMEAREGTTPPAAPYVWARHTRAHPSPFARKGAHRVHAAPYAQNRGTRVHTVPAPAFPLVRATPFARKGGM